MTTADESQWDSWYKDFDENYSPQKRRQWYSAAAEAYQWARPRYPEALVAKVIRQAELNAGDSVLEIGCGPGIATQAFAQQGLNMQCVEPSPAACELARQACAPFAQVTVSNTTFEEFPLDGKRYDAVLAATSFHWVSPAVAYQKSAAALKLGGSLILLWATPPQPREDICKHLQPIYERYQLSDKIRYQWRQQPDYQANFEDFASRVGNSQWFEPAAVEMVTSHSTYSIEKYLALLSTLSDYIALPEETRINLMADLAARLQDLQGETPLSLTHWFAAQVSPLVAMA
ncbi:MAG: class I SAM-dependent methyltransferase [Cyanobacteria bacterium J06621_3]